MKTYLKLITATTALNVARPISFENKNGWKVDAEGNLEKDGDGNPIYIGTDGKEQSVQGDTISRLNGEAAQHRKAKEAAEANLEKYKDVDPVKAKEALETLKKIDQKKLIDAGEVDKLKDEISKGFTSQLAERDKTIEGLNTNLNGLKLETSFANSDFYNSRVGVPKSMFKAEFSRHFKIEDGKVVPYDASGNKMYSKKNMGETASFDEALELLVEARADKDEILKADAQQGSGNQGNGGGRGGGRRVSRADFEKLNPVQQAETAQLAGKGELTITD